MNLIFEFDDCFTNEFCDTIIELYKDNNNDNTNIFCIPKNDKDWKRIELIIYKELLIKLNEYKIKLLSEMNLNNDLILRLNKSLYTKNLIIQKINHEETNLKKLYFIPNRYNLLSYVIFLNDIDEGGELIFNNNINEKIIKSKNGKIIFFPENKYNIYSINYPKNEYQYVITGQLYNEI
jgi:hypothetical protein